MTADSLTAPHHSGKESYATRLRGLLHSDQGAFMEALRARWEGKAGPDLRGQFSWNDLLIRMIRNAPEEERLLWFPPLARIFGDLQEKVPATITAQERLHLLGALALLQVLPWNKESPAKEAAGEILEILDTWLKYAATPEGYTRFVPYNHLEQEQFFGQVEEDLLMALLRLAAVQRPFGDIPKKIWKLAMYQAGHETTPESIVLAARRLWEMALWSGKKDHQWLATNLWPLSQILHRAEGVAGNLTRLFYLLDWRHGKESVQKMILLVRADNVPDPDRASFRKMLDYYGDEVPDAIRNHLRRIGSESSAESVVKGKEMDKNRGLSHKENALNAIRNFLMSDKDLVPCAP
ncbi:MAG: hypothetical protein H7833_03985 [Magnetococcus sp. DMHC-1]